MKKLLLVACLLVGSFHANAILITTATDGSFELTTDMGTFNDLSGLLMSQAWWGDVALAEELAGLVQTSLGMPHESGLIGVFFGFAVDPFPLAKAWCLQAKCGADTVGFFGPNFDQPIVWAIVEQVPEPSALSLLGVGLLGLLAKRRRARRVG